MAAGPKPIKELSGSTPSAARVSVTPPVTPLDELTLAQALLQLQNTVNELIKHFNAHQHAALNAAPATDLHTGAGAVAQNLFTNS